MRVQYMKILHAPILHGHAIFASSHIIYIYIDRKMLKSSEIWIFKKILNPKVACKICELQATFCAHMLSVWLTQCWWDLDQWIASQSWITIPWSLGSKTTLNHKKRDVTLGRVSVLSLYSTLQFILPRQFCRRKVQKKMYMRLERDNPIHAGALWKEDVAEQPQMKWQCQFFGFQAYFVQAFQWHFDFWWARPGMIQTVIYTPW